MNLPEWMPPLPEWMRLAEPFASAANAHALAAVEAYKASLKPWTLEGTAEELHAELAACREDAERYRWLRNEANYARKHDPLCVLGFGPEQEMVDGEQLDAAIDAARREGK